MLKFKVVVLFLLLNLTLKAQHAKHIFQPKIFYNGFSLRPASVLHLHPGDTVQTETIDAMGFDKDGVRRGRGGNPLTGPFTIEGAMPGDVSLFTCRMFHLTVSTPIQLNILLPAACPKIS